MQSNGIQAGTLLKGKVATITGAGRGIGRDIALAYARHGAAVSIGDINAESAQTTAQEIRDLGGQALGMALDVTEPESVSAYFEATARAFGALDIHVNNAGISSNALFLETELTDWDRILRVNLTGAFLCGQGAARRMLPQRSGRIINICSLSGQKGGTARAAYGASKAGLELLTKVMAVELGEQGINTTGIAPGAIETEMARKLHDKATRDAYHRLIPKRRYGTPSEVADAAVFLGSDLAGYVNGHVLNVDGGFLAAGLMFQLDEASKTSTF